MNIFVHCSLSHFLLDCVLHYLVLFLLTVDFGRTTKTILSVVTEEETTSKGKGIMHLKQKIYFFRNIFKFFLF